MLDGPARRVGPPGLPAFHALEQAVVVEVDDQVVLAWGGRRRAGCRRRDRSAVDRQPETVLALDKGEVMARQSLAFERWLKEGLAACKEFVDPEKADRMIG